MSSLLSEDCLSKLVRAFYGRVRRDARLAPIFATKIKEADWDEHMDHITDFWCSIFLKTRQFTGNPMRKHLDIKGITPAHFEQWLSLFCETAEHILLAGQAEEVCAMAHRIGKSLQMGLAFNFERSGQDDHPFTDFSMRVSH